MAPLTKKKSSKSHTKERRQHFGIVIPVLIHCSQCNTLKIQHEVCHTCGYYDGRQAIKIEEPKKTE